MLVFVWIQIVMAWARHGHVYCLLEGQVLNYLLFTCLSVVGCLFPGSGH